MERLHLTLQLEHLTDVLKHERILKIDANSLIKFKSEIDYYGFNSAERKVGMIDRFKTHQLILSKHLPAERYNGVMNLLYATYCPDATTAEIESALVDTSKYEISFLNIQTAVCMAQNYQYIYSNDFRTICMDLGLLT